MISVIIPIYNVEKYLSDCIDSVLNQTYSNLEIILVDDGSTDNSGKICDSYEKKYSNIKTVHKKNAGLGYARNTGLEHATGDYVMFLDSDDYLDNDCLAILMKYMIDNSLDLVKSGLKRVTDSQKIIYKSNYDDKLYVDLDIKNELLPKTIGSSPNKSDSIDMSVCGSIYKLNIIKNNKLKFYSERDVLSEDLLFNIEYLILCDRCMTISYIGYNYRYNLNSLTTKYRRDRFEKVKYLYNHIENIIEKNNYTTDIDLRKKKSFFINVRMCINQERRRVSKKNNKESLLSISNICNDPLTINAIKEYPINDLGFKQKVFIFLIKHKNIRTLLFLANHNIL